jgi:hypothetical protein
MTTALGSTRYTHKKRHDPSDSYQQFQEVVGKEMERNEFNAFKGY